MGAGFAGLAAARRLGDRGIPVTVVDEHNYHTFQPLLYQVATAALPPDGVAHSVRGVLRKDRLSRFVLAKATAVDLERQEVLLDRGHPVGYDYLVLAAGAATTFYGIPGVAANVLPLKTLPEAVALRNHLLATFEDAAVSDSAPDDALTVVVVGGGPTGVEMAGALHELVTRVLRHDYPELPVDKARVVLVERADDLMLQFAPSLRRYTQSHLARLGIQLRLGQAIVAADDRSVTLADGTVIPTRTVAWTAGMGPTDLAGALGTGLEGGRVPVQADLRLEARPNVFVVGDMAGAHDRRGEVHPQLAPVAMQQGRHAAEQIEALAAGRLTEPFVYRDRGIMATLSRKAAIAQLPLRVRLTGRPARVAWLFLHLLYLVGFRNRASVLLDWAWSYLTNDRAARLLLRSGTAADPPSPPR